MHECRRTLVQSCPRSAKSPPFTPHLFPSRLRHTRLAYCRQRDDTRRYILCSALFAERVIFSCSHPLMSAMAARDGRSQCPFAMPVRILSSSVGPLRVLSIQAAYEHKTRDSRNLYPSLTKAAPNADDDSASNKRMQQNATKRNSDGHTSFDASPT